MVSIVTICVAVFTISILLSGTIAPSLVQEVDAKTAAKDTHGNKKGEVCGSQLCSDLPKQCQVTGPKADVSNCNFSGANFSGMKFNQVIAI